MIYFFTPYSFELKLLDAITAYMELLQPEDWAVIMDGDTAFLHPNFGHQIQRHIEAHPEAGLFTFFASRCHYSIQVPPGVNMNKDSIRYHKLIASLQQDLHAGETTEINRRIAGHLMVIKKSTSDKILPMETSSESLSSSTCNLQPATIITIITTITITTDSRQP
ncbi:MAG: hypothetical protein D4R64_18500 [Porphyromonadaceae bacterium]|nr:MAG: hypothetical protein D4R64_18500 [Porphyromonadaceae bacterium]